MSLDFYLEPDTNGARDSVKKLRDFVKDLPQTRDKDWLEGAIDDVAGHIEHLSVLGEAAPSIFSANITHNVHGMWNLAGCSDALYESEGKKASDVIPELREGVQRMEADPPAYEALNAKNGWGLYEHALPFLREVLAACEAHPDAIIRISR